MAVTVAAASTSAPSSSINNRLSFKNRLPFSRLTPNFLSSKAKPLSKSLKLTSSQIPAHFTPPPSRSLPLIRYLFPLSRCRSTSEEIGASVDDGEGESEPESEMESEPEEEEGGGEVEEKGEKSNSLGEGRLYVGNLPFSTTTFQLIDIFKEAGAVQSAEIIYDRVTDRSRGFAFVTMETLEEAKTAIRMFNESLIGGRAVKVNFPEVPRGGERKVLSPKMKKTKNTGFVDSPHKIYAGNLGWGLTSEGLKQVFSSQPGFLSAKVIYERGSGRSRGFGFVSFSSAEKAEAALNSMNGREVEGRPLRLNMAITIARTESSSLPSSPSVRSDDTTEQQEASMGTSEMVSSSPAAPMSSVAESEPEKSLGTAESEMVSSSPSAPMSSVAEPEPEKSMGTAESEMVSSSPSAPMSSVAESEPEKSMGTESEMVSSSPPAPMSSVAEPEPEKSMGTVSEMVSSSPSFPMSSVAESEPEKSMGTEGEVVSSSPSTPVSSLADSEQEKSMDTKNEVVSSSPPTPKSIVDSGNGEQEEEESVGAEGELVSGVIS